MPFPEKYWHPYLCINKWNLGLLHINNNLVTFVGAEPNKSTGDPAVGILSLHQATGEATPAAEPGGVPPT